MKHRIKLGNLVNGIPALQKLAEKNLTTKTLYKVSKLIARLEDDIEFYNSERGKILADLAERTEGDIFKLPPENIDAYEQRMKELMDIELEGDIQPVAIPTTENIEMSYRDLQALEGFVELVLVE